MPIVSLVGVEPVFHCPTCNEPLIEEKGSQWLLRCPECHIRWGGVELLKMVGRKIKQETARPMSRSPLWTGDLDDDCTAYWDDYVLRAEDMGGGWWWCVYRVNGLDKEEIDSCWMHRGTVRDGDTARRAAESSARRHASKTGVDLP